MERPNILILLADQHRASSTGYGGNPDVSTPHLDRMAREGVSVSTCVSTHPLCAPYRACLQTGQPASVNGVLWNSDSIRRELPTLAGLFREQGYSTAYFGKCHWHEPFDDSIHTPPDWRLGWEHWDGWQNGHEDYDLPSFDSQGKRQHPHAGRFAPAVQTEQFLDWHARSEGPWIAQINWGPPHNATLSEEELEPLREPSRRINEELGLGLRDHHFQNTWWWVQSFPQYLVRPVVPESYLEAIDPGALTLPAAVHPDNHLLIRHHLREYYAQIAALDDLTGTILSKLDQRGELDNTIVLYTSDHGDWVGSHRDPERNCRGKGDARQASVRVPFVLRGPGIPPGKVSEIPVSTVDLLPTLCGLAGFQPEGEFPGNDLSKMLTGAAPATPRVVQMELRDWRAAYDGTWLYCECRQDDSWVPASLVHTREDPEDLNNRVDDPECDGIRSNLKEALGQT